MKEMRVRLTFTEEVLGGSCADPEIHRKYIASNSKNTEKIEEEVAAVTSEETVDDKKTIFPKQDGKPFAYDYQIRGFFKDACGMLRYVTDSKSSKLTAYKKKIDGTIFVKDRRNFFYDYDEIGICQRPLRAETAQGPRVALASSESLPAGTKLEFTVVCLNDTYMPYVEEWLDYGKYKGFSQWSNSGKGRFEWEVVE